MARFRTSHLLRSGVSALALVLSIGAASGYGQQASEEESKISIVDRMTIAGKIYASVDPFFGHFIAVPDLDLDAAYKQYVAQIVGSDDRLNFDMATLKFMGQLHNGHSDFFDPWLWKSYSKYMGLSAVCEDGHWWVTASYWPDAVRGDEIASIDGEKIEDYFQRQKPYLCVSSEREAKTQFFSSSFLFPQSFQLTLASGKTFKVDRNPVIPPPTGPVPKFETTAKWIEDGKIAYIRVPSFGSPEFEQKALEFVKQYKDAPVMIIDVRGNGGGSTPSGLVRALMNRPYRWDLETTPMSIALARVHAKRYEGMTKEEKEKNSYAEVMEDISRYRILLPNAFEEPDPAAYKGKLYILVNRQVGSAAEDFVMPFKDNHRALLVGQRTYGSTGQPFYYKFPNGMTFRVSSKRDYLPDGSEFEGVGVPPDLEIPWTEALLRTPGDPFLDRTVELATKDLSKP